MILAISCIDKKDDCSSGEYYHLKDDFKSLKFSIGSNWIFKSSKGYIDTISVTDISSGYYLNPPPVHGLCGVKHDYYRMNVHSSFFKSIHIYFLDDNGLRIDPNPYNDYYTCGKLVLPVNYDSTDLNYKTIDSIKTEISIFRNLTYFKHFIDPNDICYNQLLDDSVIYYSNMELGIIKKEVIENGEIINWDLIKYQIKRAQ